MQVKEYTILSECIDCGVEAGWNRAHKHEDNPDASTIISAIQDAVLGEICERFDFELSPEEKCLLQKEKP